MKIENDEEHGLLLEIIGAVTDIPISPDQARWLDLLAVAIEAYELKHHPIADPTPEEAAAFRADEGGPICIQKGHVPIQKLSAVICDRCGDVLKEGGVLQPYTCPNCGAVSHNPNDAREQYCGACHSFATAVKAIGAGPLHVGAIPAFARAYVGRWVVLAGEDVSEGTQRTALAELERLLRNVYVLGRERGNG